MPLSLDALATLGIRQGSSFRLSRWETARLLEDLLPLPEL